MNTPVHAADELPHQALLFLRVFVVDGVELPQKLSRAADHAEKVGILPADEGFAGEALFVFRGHDSSLFRKRRRAIDEAPGVFFLTVQSTKEEVPIVKKGFRFFVCTSCFHAKEGRRVVLRLFHRSGSDDSFLRLFFVFLIRIKFVRGERRGFGSGKGKMSFVFKWLRNSPRRRPSKTKDKSK